MIAHSPLGVGVGIRSAREGNFADVFFFSVQTFSTIGYGYMAPTSNYVHMISLVESFVGIVFTAVVTGSLFAKLSKPISRVAWSKHVIVQTIDGVPNLVFRIANQRNTPIVNASISITVLLKRVTAEGEASFGYKALTLDVKSMPVFVGGMRVRHAIDEKSPLFGVQEAGDWRRFGIASFQALVHGTEEVYGHAIFARHVYDIKQIHFGYRFKRMLEESASGKLTVHLEYLDEIVAEENTQKVMNGSFVVPSRRLSDQQRQRRSERRVSQADDGATHLIA